jgi:hypothetical protein
LLSDDGRRVVEGVEVGEDATAVGLAMARRLLAELARIY